MKIAVINVNFIIGNWKDVMAWLDNKLHLASICTFVKISYLTSIKTIFTHSRTLDVSLRTNASQKSFTLTLTETVKLSML